LKAKDIFIDKIIKVFDKVLIIAKSISSEKALHFYSFNPSLGKFARDDGSPDFKIAFDIEHYQLHVNQNLRVCTLEFSFIISADSGSFNHLKRARIWFNQKKSAFEHAVEVSPIIEPQKNSLVTDWRFVDLRSETSLESDRFFY
jgi:hypothetical protein